MNINEALRQIRAWERAAQSMADQATLHYAEARKAHARGLHQLEERHMKQARQTVDRYNRELLPKKPRNARFPKLPRLP